MGGSYIIILYYSLLCHYSFVYALKHNGMRTDWVPCANTVVVITGVEESLVDETNSCWECVERGHPTQSVFNTSPMRVYTHNYSTMPQCIPHTRKTAILTGLCKYQKPGCGGLGILHDGMVRVSHNHTHY